MFHVDQGEGHEISPLVTGRFAEIVAKKVGTETSDGVTLETTEEVAQKTAGMFALSFLSTLTHSPMVGLCLKECFTFIKAKVTKSRMSNLLAHVVFCLSDLLPLPIRVPDATSMVLCPCVFPPYVMTWGHHHIKIFCVIQKHVPRTTALGLGPQTHPTALHIFPEIMSGRKGGFIFSR